MKIVSRTVGAFQENAYLVVDESTQRAVFVDPGAEGDRLVRMVEDAQVTLEAIWLTHAHVDHVGGITPLVKKYGVPVYMHPSDAILLQRSPELAKMYGIPFDPPPPADRDLTDGDTLTLGALRFTVMHTPGHAPGHCVFVGEGVMLGGDLLFAGSIGRTDLPFSNPADMQRSLGKVAELAPATAVHPGHGPSTSIGLELEQNPFLNGVARVLVR